MTWLALAALLGQADPGPPVALPWAGGRVLTTRAVHLGIRPAAFVDDEGDRQALEWGAGVTVQMTVPAL